MRAHAKALLLGLVLTASLFVGVSSASAYLTAEGSYGAYGSGDGRFDEAKGAAVNEASGDVYVVDSNNSRVQRFDSDGTYLSQFGEAGSGPGQFNSPRRIAIDQADGSVYVVDTGNDRVQKFDASGAFLEQFGETGSGDGQFSGPHGIAIDQADGDVLVVDTGNNRVQRFDSDGTYLSQFGEAGSGDGQLDGPTSAAVDSAGNVYVLKQFGRLQKFDSAGTYLDSIDVFWASDVAVDLETDRPLVYQFTEDFERLRVTEYTTAGDALESFLLGPAMGGEPGLAFDSAGRRGFATNGSRVTILVEPPPLFDQKVVPYYSEAELSARVLPRGEEVQYHFEYGPTAAYGTSTETLTIGPGQTTPVRIKARVLGLQEATTYHFRAVATIGNETIAGPDRSFTTLTRPSADNCPNAAIRAARGSSQIGDCRAFEMVSPSYKNGGDVQLSANRAAADGSALYFQARTGFADGEGNARVNGLISRRAGDGWATKSLTPYLTPPTEFFLPSHGYEDFTANLGDSILISNHAPYERTASVENDQLQLYHRTAAGTFSEVSPAAAEPAMFVQPIYVGGSRDLSRVFFESDRKLLPDAPPVGTTQLYEWDQGQLSIAGTLPGGAVAAGGAQLARSGNPRSAVSGDGSQIVTVIGDQLYVREAGGDTTAISLSQKSGEEGEPAAGGAVLFDTFSPDGSSFSKIYFTSPAALTDDATVGSEGQGRDLYEYDVASGELRDLVTTEDPANPHGAQVRAGNVGDWPGAVSRNGEYLYFKAAGLLAQGGSQNDTSNVYVLHEGEVTHVGNQDFFEPPMGISDDGTTVLRFTEDKLTDDETDKQVQAYIYDALTGTSTCISCIPGGVSGSAALQAGGSNGGIGFMGFYYQRRNLLPDGSRAFFETSDALVPQDTNGAPDVYEWEGGEVKLISSGRGAEGAHFIDASVSGDDVFIGTRERLLPTDVDDNMDAYDARVNGGQPLPPPPGAPCEGDACQSPPRPPSDPTPASAGLRGPGNEKPRFAKKARQKKQKKRAGKRKHRKAQAKKSKSGRTARANG